MIGVPTGNVQKNGCARPVKKEGDGEVRVNAIVVPWHAHPVDVP